MIAARVLGTFHLSVDGRVIERADWQRLSAERLVKLLLVTEGHTLPRELAIETLWPDMDPGRGNNAFRKALHFARRALGVPGALNCDRSTVCLDPAELNLDLDRLRSAFDRLGRAHSRPPSSSHAHDASGDFSEPDAVATVLQLGATPLLPDDAYEDWLAGPREQLLNRWQLVAMQAAETAAADGRVGDAHAILERVLDRDPTDEAAHRLVIELYASEGRHHAARRQFELCRRALACLDLAPSAETEAAYRRAEAGAAAATTAAAPHVRLVARKRELALVEPLLDRLQAGRPAALIVRGPAGIGKTRLLEEIRELGHGAGWRELSWQAIETSHPFALAPFALRLAELVSAGELAAWEEPQRSAVATVLPGLGLRPHLEFADRSALVVGLVGALARIARGRPLLVAIDDVPWLDEASVEVIRALTSAGPNCPIFVAVTYRDEESLPAAVTTMLDGLRRSGALELRLGPLAERDVEPLVLAHLGGESIAPDVTTWLFARSEGNPLFCLEVTRDSVERGALRLDNARWHATGGQVTPERESEPPKAVRQLVAARIASLEPTAATLLQTAAELGPIVGYGTLAAVLPDLRERLIPALDSALASGLLVELAGGYAFAHPLFRAAIVSESGMARRAGLHLALAKALGQESAGDREEDPLVLASRCLDPGPAAEHALAAYELGMPDAGPFAVALGFTAGLRARRLFDRETATSFLERTTSIWSSLPASIASRFDAATAFVNLAELRMAADDETGAEVAFRTALSAARTPDELADAYEHFFWLPYRHADFAGAISVCEEGLSRLPAGSAGAAVIELHVGWCLGHGLRRIEDAIDRMEAAIPALEPADQASRLSLGLSQLGLLLAFAGRWAEGYAALERALALALELGDARLEVLTRPHLVMVLNQAGRPAEARPHAYRALALTEQMGDGYMTAAMSWFTADVEDVLGNCDAAADLRRKELAWLARLGGNPHNEALAHAHLANLARRSGDGSTEAAEADCAAKAAALDADPGYAAWIDEAVKAERWAEVVAQER